MELNEKSVTVNRSAYQRIILKRMDLKNIYLIDEYRLCLVPALIGKGNPLFKPAPQMVAMRLLEARPLTGRTHQIRVHLVLEGLPILGDPWDQTKTSKKIAASKK